MKKFIFCDKKDDYELYAADDYVHVEGKGQKITLPRDVFLSLVTDFLNQVYKKV